MKKINTILVILVLFLAINSLKAQTYPIPKFSVHIHGGYTMTLPDLKGTFPADLTKNPVPYFIKNGFNFGADAKYYVDKKSTFGIMLSLTYSMLSSGDVGVTSLDTNSQLGIGQGTWRADMRIITIGLGAEYDFAPKRPANPFVNVQFTTNIIGGTTKFDASGGSIASYSKDMSSAIRFGAMFGAGVDIKMSKKIGVIIGGRYHFVNLFGKDSTENTSTTYGLNDKETTTMKAKKMPFLQFFAGISFYFGQKKYVPIKK